MAAYPHYKQTSTGWTVWIQPKMRMYKMQCCDCGLVHNMQYRMHGGRIQFRVQRNNRSTALARRHRKPKPSML